MQFVFAALVLHVSAGAISQHLLGAPLLSGSSYISRPGAQIISAAPAIGSGLLGGGYSAYGGYAAAPAAGYSYYAGAPAAAGYQATYVQPAGQISYVKSGIPAHGSYISSALPAAAHTSYIAPAPAAAAISYTSAAAPAYTSYAAPAYTSYAAPAYTSYAAPAYGYAAPAIASTGYIAPAAAHISYVKPRPQIIHHSPTQHVQVVHQPRLREVTYVQKPQQRIVKVLPAAISHSQKVYTLPALQPTGIIPIGHGQRRTVENKVVLEQHKVSPIEEGGSDLAPGNELQGGADISPAPLPAPAPIAAPAPAKYEAPGFSPVDVQTKTHKK